MIKKVPLCGVCIHKMENAYKVTEVSRREKVTCEQCKKKRYGALCEISKKR